MGSIVDISEVLLELGLATSTVTDEERAIAQASIAKAEAAVIKHLKYDPVKRSRVEYYPQAAIAGENGPGVWEADANSAYIRQASTGATDLLQIRHLPIRSDVSIDLRIDYDGRFGANASAFGSSTQKAEGTDYWPSYDGVDDDGNKLCRDGIVRSIGMWPVSPGSVKITYTAGYTSAEFRGEKSLVDATLIWEAVVDEAVRRANKVFAYKKNTKVGFMTGPMKSEELGDYSYTVDTSVMRTLIGSVNDLLPETKSKVSDFVNMGYVLGG